MRLVRILAMLAVAMAATLALTATASAATCLGYGYLVTSDGTIQRFSTSTNAVTTTVEVPGANFVDVAVSPTGRTLYAVDSSGNTIRAFDATTGVATATITGFSAPIAIALSPDAKRAYVANQTARTVTVVDTTTNTIVTAFSVSSGSAPTDLVVSPDGSLVYITVGNALQVRSTSDGTLQKTYALAGNAQAVALSATTAYTAIDTPFQVESALLSGSTSGMLYDGMAGQPRKIAISPDGATLYVGTGEVGVGSLLSATIGSNTLTRVGTTTSFGVTSIAVTPDSVTVYAASAGEVAVLPRGTSTPTTLTGDVRGNITAVAVCPSVTDPGAPTAVTAVPGDATVSLSWAAPANSGGASILSYTGTAAPGGATCTTTGATTCLFTGLKNGTEYTFTVTATNIAGTSAASAASTKVTPRRDNSARVLTVGLPTITFTKRGIGIATSITVTGAGTIAQVATFKGDRYCNLSRRVTAAGTYRVRCVIKAAGRKLSRTRAVSYTLRSTFSPTNGLVASNSQTVRVPRRR
ncbi:MAG: fibronectin type III domain-containing protein [Thermoleophilia bacterium]|nr:fibronectin type III domain-containing protein [Thermoleophilia bacterium]